MKRFGWLVCALGLGGCCFGAVGGGADLSGVYMGLGTEVACEYHLRAIGDFPGADVICGQGPDSAGGARLQITDGASATPQVAVRFEAGPNSVECAAIATRTGTAGAEMLSTPPIACTLAGGGCEFAPVMLVVQQTGLDTFSIQGGTFAGGTCAGSGSMNRASFTAVSVRRSM